MANPNAKLLSQEIEHALRAAGASNRLARQVAAALARYDEQILAVLAAGIAKAVEAVNQKTAVASLLAKFEKLNREAVAAAFRVLARAMRAFAATEAEYFLNLLARQVSGGLSAPAGSALGKAIQGTFILGESLAEQEARFAEYRFREIAKVVRQGVFGGLGTDEILAQVQEKGGAIAKSKEAVENVARTNTQAAGTLARNEVYKKNPGTVVGQYWSSVLDAKTTPICRANDGATRTLTPEQVAKWEAEGMASIAGADAEGPFDGIPWSNGYRGPYPAHYGERSIIVPLVNRAAPDKLTFEEWFNSKPATVQEQLLGPSRYALWKSGKFSLRDFVNDRGRTLTLAELRAKDRAAFDAAVDEAEGAA